MAVPRVSKFLITGRDHQAIVDMSETHPPGFHYSGDFVRGRLDNQRVNFHGVVSDLLPPSKSRGPDWQLTFDLVDPNGCVKMPVKFFVREEENLPKVRLNGDVVFLENMKVNVFNYKRSLLSTYDTKWWVLRKDYILAPDMDERRKVMDDGEMIYFSSPDAGELTYHMRQRAITYRNWIKTMIPLSENADTAHLYEAPHTRLRPATTRSSTTTDAPAATVSTSMPTSNITDPLPSASINQPRDKLVTLANIKVEGQGSFYDLKGTVVKIFYDLRQDITELYITDYTENDLLHDHQPEANAIVADDNWPGPYGKRTLRVDLVSPHGPWARSNVVLGDIVRMNNVRVKWSNNSTEVEGNLWRDQHYPDKVLVRVLEHEKDNVLRDFRAEYVKKRAADISSGPSKESKAAAKRRRRKEKLVREAVGGAGVGGEGAGLTSAPAPLPVLPEADSRLNPNVKFDMKEHGIDKESTLDQIINNPRRETVTPKGRKFTLPFVNTRHVARLWVADYYPHDLKDFVRQVPTVDGKTKWQWYFQLIVCDADVDRTKVKTKGLSAEQVISLKVQDKEAITLLGGLQPHDLNTRRGESTIKKLQEKLFILWGDLAEMKDKYLASHPEITPDRQFSYISHLLLINNRPFTAGIREYGVEDGKGELELHRWNKYWEIFDTRIV